MIGDRYWKPRTSLHFLSKLGDMNQMTNYVKIRSLTDAVRERSVSVCHAVFTDTVDERVFLFAGSSGFSFRQFVPLKLNLLCPKNFVLAASNSMVSDFRLYVGKVTDNTENDFKQLGLGTAVIELFCVTASGDGCHIMCDDRFLTSVKCAGYLLRIVCMIYIMCTFVL
jgi:hypothetical protein